MDSLLLTKGLVQGALLIVVFCCFGLKSWHKYQDEKTLVTTAELDLGKITAPSVTVCAIDAETNLGFDNKSLKLQDFPTSEIVGTMCPDLEGDDIVKCVEENAFNLTTIVKNAGKGMMGTNDLSESRFWSPEFSYSNSGICQTLHPNMTMGTTIITDAIRIELSNTFSNWIVIHDRNLFLFNSNPSMPFKAMSINEMKMYKFMVVRHENIDVASKHCNPDPSYIFTACIKNTISKEVGCRLHWDKWTDRALPNCHQTEQYR